MTLTFLSIYNDVAGQAWSMYDGDAESSEEMESALKSSINKALSELWTAKRSRTALISLCTIRAVRSMFPSSPKCCPTLKSSLTSRTDGCSTTN